ncbi:MAG: 2-dehydro-3-deoxy-D-gluconate 5-dehydrogenase KduD [Chloroflexi bacterium]|nr:2-dehydro-3-deoxy-D-gluconate 5-dehydrogenase KduD [Chloroflexota bacterium]
MSILDTFRLDSKVALVTGASRGLGQALAVGLAEAGADVAAISRSACDKTRQQVEATGRQFVHVPVDLATVTPADLEAVVADVVATRGRLDILVNNAGTTRRAPALKLTEDDWDVVLQVNLKAVFFLSQAAARHMAGQGGGKIIHIASMLSYQGGILVSPYAASKSGVAGLTHALANEWAAHHINVNAIAPGYMLTEMTAPLAADPDRNPAILARIPAGRWGTPDDLKGLVVFLASAAADYMHGTIVPVDGGWLSR